MPQARHVRTIDEGVAHQHLVVQLHALDAAVHLSFRTSALSFHLDQVQCQVKQLILQTPALQKGRYQQDITGVQEPQFAILAFKLWPA
jgi:hypothetical protein